MLLLPVHLVSLQILCPVLMLIFEIHRYCFFDFNITYPGKLIFQIYKSCTILIHCLEESSFVFKFDVQWR